MPTAHLIHGYLCAGKTTVAKQLEIELGAVRYSLDEWMVKRYGHNPPDEKFTDYVRQVYRLINRRWPKDLARGVDVILDFGFWTKEWRDDARRRAEEVNAATRLYWVQCAENTALARCRARNRNTEDSLFIQEQSFEELKERFEPLGPDEPFELVKTDK